MFSVWYRKHMRLDAVLEIRISACHQLSQVSYLCLEFITTFSSFLVRLNYMTHSLISLIHSHLHTHANMWATCTVHCLKIKNTLALSECSLFENEQKFSWNRMLCYFASEWKMTMVVYFLRDGGAGDGDEYAKNMFVYVC